MINNQTKKVITAITKKIVDITNIPYAHYKNSDLLLDVIKELSNGIKNGSSKDHNEYISNLFNESGERKRNVK